MLDSAVHVTLKLVLVYIDFVSLQLNFNSAENRTPEAYVPSLREGKRMQKITQAFQPEMVLRALW